MIRRLAALLLLTTLSQTVDIPHQIPLTVAELGDDLTLTCQTSNDFGLLYWYKLNFGYMVQTIAEGSFDKMSLKGQFNNLRFSVTKAGDVYSLNIKNVSKEDEGTYLCQSGAAYMMQFINGTVLAVNDHKNQQRSVYVKQSPETESVRLNEPVTLQCSLLSKNKDNRVQCPGEHSVYWFRAGAGGSRPSIIYTHRNSIDEQEQRSCVHSLSKTIRSSSDTGTYYCAVVTCGEILFGEGTQVQTRQELCPFVIVLGTLLACSVIVIVALIISRNQKPVFNHGDGDITTSNHADHGRSAEEQPSNVDGEATALNYVALDFPSRKRERWTTNRELPQDCVYSGISR